MSPRLRILLLLAASGLVYANTLPNDFAYDDGFFVLDNHAVTTFSLPELFRPIAKLSAAYYRPLTSTTWAMNWALAGARPCGYHFVNLLLHVAVTLLLYFLLQKLFEKSPQATNISFAAALLFAVHPIHTEAVAWISGRSELLVAVFLLAAWLLHLKDRPLASAACFVLALLSKESAVVFFPLVLAGDYALAKYKPLSRYLTLSALTVLYVAFLWKLQGGHFAKGPSSPLDNMLANLPPLWRILNALRIAWKYVALQLYPANLSVDYSYNAIPLYAAWSHTLPAAIATLAVIALCIWAGLTKRREWMLAGVIYLGAFAVTANVLVPTGTIMAERLAYLPSIGICLLLALLWINFEALHSKAAFSLLAAVVVLLGARTVLRNRDWQNNFTLYSAAVKTVPDSARAHGLLGQEYLRRGELLPAASEFQLALNIFPDYPQAIENYGLAESRLGDDEKARLLLTRALRISNKSDGDYSFRAVTLAAWLLQHHDDDAALQILNQVIVDYPGESRAWSNRAVIHYHRREFAAATNDAQQALRLDPASAQAQGLLAELTKNAPAN
jgi:protein O-mannosyl-transferase